MRYKIFAIFAAFAFALAGTSAVSAQTKAKNQLAAQLPASDGVVIMDVQRILNETAPQILSGKPEMLSQMNAKLDEIRDKTGLDARQFEQIVIGVAMKEISAKEVDLEPLFLARGKFNAGALIAVAKLAAKGKFREEKISSRTIYIFAGKEIAAQNKPQTKNSWLNGMIDRLVNSLTKEIAVTLFDNNTLAFGSPARIRETFENKSRVSNEVLNLVSKKPNAILSFGATLPNGLSNFIDLYKDELGETLDSIRQISGAVEVSAGSAAVSVTAKTLNLEQAESLHGTLGLLQNLGKTFIKGESQEKKVYVRLLDNARITRSQTEVSLDVQVPQSDINILLAGIK